jgi:hypothetical protein
VTAAIKIEQRLISCYSEVYATYEGLRVEERINMDTLTVKLGLV